MTAILKITDGTTEVDLLGTDGYILNSWRPAISGYKGGGTYQSSSLSDGRRLVHKTFENVIERLDLKASGASQDILIRTTQELRRLLEKASDYWTTSWQDEPVWIEAKASRETNTRYAIIQAGKIPDDDNPMSQPFLQPRCEAVMDGLTLLVERGHWLANEPGDGVCVEVSGEQDWAMNYPLVFDGDTQKITIPQAASIDNRPGAGNRTITAHGWIRANSYGEGDAGRIIVKGSDDSPTRGWHFYIDNANGLIAYVDCATQDAISRSGLDEFTADGEWHYVLMTYSETGAGLPAARTIYLNVDGNWIDSYTLQQVSIGVYDIDDADDMVIGNNVASSRGFDGEIGWMEFKDYILHSPDHGDFTAPARCPLPEPDAGSAFLGIYEGDGVAIDDLGPNANDGTAANDEWGDGCGVEFGRGETSETNIYPLVYDADTQLITVAQVALIDDLPDGGTHPGGVITVHGWIKAYGYGETGSGRIAVKGSNDLVTRGWHFYVDSGTVIAGKVDYDDTHAWSITAAGSFTNDGEWHHVLMLYNEAVAGGGMPAIRTVFLAIDGVWETAYSTHQVSIGNYLVDNADDMTIGNNVAATTTFDGEIGWLEVVGGAPYLPGAGNFTPPPRCPLPEPDALSVFLGIYEGVGTYIEDLSGNDNIGTAINAIWGEPCGEVVADPDCGDAETYFANKHNMAQLTHIYYYDASLAAYSANMIAAALPFNLLPPVPADTPDDYVVFGIDTSVINSGPFCSLVFDIGDVQTGITDIDWEFWSSVGPGWVALEVQDNTDDSGLMVGGIAFDTAGVGSVHWVQDDDWIANLLNGVTAYWVRAVVTAADAGATAPTQQNRGVYTITWPFVEIAADQIGGDIDALMEMVTRCQSTYDPATTLTLYAARVIAGLRSVERGENFTAYINISDEQNPTGISISPSFPAAYADDVTTITGRKYTWTPPLNDIYYRAVYVVLDDVISDHFYGIYHAYLRTEQIAGAIGEAGARLSVGPLGVVDDAVFYETDTVYTRSLSSFQLLDMGRFEIPGALFTPGQPYGTIYINIDLINTNVANNAAPMLEVHDLILMPADEWICDTDIFAWPTTSNYGKVHERHTGSISIPKRDITSLARFNTEIFDANDIISPLSIKSRTAILQENKQQKLWFLCGESSFDRWQPCIAHNVEVEKLERYLSARGNR